MILDSEQSDTPTPEVDGDDIDRIMEKLIARTAECLQPSRNKKNARKQKHALDALIEELRIISNITPTGSDTAKIVNALRSKLLEEH